MTITNSGVRQTYAGNGVTKAFAVPFAFFGADEIEVWSLTSGVFTRLTRGTHYSVTGGGGTTGTVTAVDAPATGTSWNLRRATNRTQTVNWTNDDPFDGDTTETALDRLVALAQEADEANGRSVRAAPGEAALNALPTVANRANKALLFGADGQPTAGDLTPSTVPVSTVMQPVLAAPTLASARSAMGIPLGAGVVNVKDTGFGATGNGAADDSAAITAVMASATNGVMYFPPGIYKLGSGVTWKKGWTIRGAGPHVSTIAAGAAGLTLLSHTATALAEAFDIADIRFDAAGFASVVHISLDGTDATKKCGYISMRNLYFNGGIAAARLRYCDNAVLSDFYTSSCYDGISNEYCTHTFVQGGTFQSGGGAAIYVTSAAGYGHTRIVGVNSDGMAKGLYLNAADYGTVTGCSFLNAASGPVTAVNARGWRISASEFSNVSSGSPGAPGVVLDSSCERMIVIGNQIYNNTYGISAAGLRHILSNNQLYANTSNDIALGNLDNSVIAANLCESALATSIEELAGCDYNVIAGNTTNGAVTVVGANTVVNGNNVVY